MVLDNRYGAFIVPELKVMPLGYGPLDNLSFAVKDVFAVAGHTSSAGNPSWLQTHSASTYHADAVRRLLIAGASLRGAALTDELMYSLGGENYHYGTPVNPRAAGRIPGGSSSGSAVAVASGSVDFALGTDTGGSIRVPSSYCGVYGFRPTHGAVGMKGVIQLAPSFDTVGWMAGDTERLRRVGEVLLPMGNEPVSNTMEHIYIATDAWALADEAYEMNLSQALRRLQWGAGRSTTIEIAPEGLKAWMDVFRELQGREIWASHGEWIEQEQPKFGPDIAERFAWASSLGEMGLSTLLLEQREGISSRLHQLLGETGCLVIPTVPGPAPLRGGDSRQLEINRSRAMMLCCIAGLAGLPQVTLPIESEDDLPLGLSIIGGYGQDLRLLTWLKEVWI